MTNDETIRVDSGRLSLCKGEGRVRVEHRIIVWPEPLTSILSPSVRGEANPSTLSKEVVPEDFPSAIPIF
jgi:hypothetical protein